MKMKRTVRLGDEAATRTMAVAGALLGVAIGGALHLAREPASPTVQPPFSPPPRLEVPDWPTPVSESLPTPAVPGASARGKAPEALHGPPAEQVTMATRDAPRPPPPAATSSRDVPYRFLGRTGTGADTALILFGRGRVVTVRGPGPLDEEHAVDHVSDDHLLIRHLPSGAGRIVPLVLRGQASDMPAQAPESPAD